MPNPDPAPPDDPLWRLRHALAGLALAVLLAVPVAAWLGAALADAAGGGYGARVGAYAALLVHVVVGAGVLMSRVGRHETRPLSAGRVARWFVSLWLWPLLLLSARARTAARGEAGGEAGNQGGGDTGGGRAGDARGDRADDTRREAGDDTGGGAGPPPR